MSYRVKVDRPEDAKGVNFVRTSGSSDGWPVYFTGIECPVSAPPGAGGMIGAAYVVGELQKAVAGGEQITWEKASDHRHWFFFK